MATKTKTPEPCDDIMGGISLACGAIQYMAGSLAIGQETFRHLLHHERGEGHNASLELAKKHRAALLKALVGLDCVLQQIGDYLNGCDGCEKIDELATESAFKVVGHVLRGKPLDDDESDEDAYDHDT